MAGGKVTLLCSAAATGLSKISTVLNERTDLKVIDLEEILKRIYPWDDRDIEDRNMAAVCGENDRRTVLNYWDRAFGRSLREVVDSGEDSHPVISCHLTLFSPTRLEFYSPPLARRFLTQNDVAVDRVVVLIDDVYDMLARLSVPSGIYDSELALSGHVSDSQKLTDGSSGGENIEEFSTEDINTLSVEVTTKSILRLLHWRRSEMIAAEELARNLDVPLTVFAVKHEMSALVRLLTDPQALPVYLSHKITEPRVENIARAREGDVGRWPVLTDQVNSIAGLLLEHGVVGVQPTAIDELRFEKNWSNSGRLDRYSGRLADRWPVPSGALYATSRDGAPRHEHMLDLNLSSHDRYRHGLFGLLQHTIYDEIAFRDHLLVSCNAGLLVFRPLAMGARVSGGVEEEIAHWALEQSRRGESHRPGVLVHSYDEIIDFFTDLDGEFRRRAALTAFHQKMHVSLGASMTDRLWASCVVGDVPVEVFQKTAGVHLRRAREIPQAFERALASAIPVTVSLACGVDIEAARSIAHYAARSPDECLDDAFVARVANYLKVPTESARTTANSEFSRDLIDFSKSSSALEVIRLLAGISE